MSQNCLNKQKKPAIYQKIVFFKSNYHRSFAVDEIGLKLEIMVIRITNPLAGNQRYDRDRYDKI